MHSTLFSKIREFKKILHVPVDYPLIRGMVSYGIIWPSASLAQGYLERGGPLHDYQPDYARAGRFSIFGAFLMAPMWHGWMRYSNRFFLKKDITTAVKRSFIEGLTFSPLATGFFFFGITALELKPVDDCLKEVREKFWPTYKVGFFFWPTVQTMNFYFVPERHRLTFVSFASFLFTMFLSYMKDRQKTEEKEK